MPSIDASIPRDELFRCLVRLFGQGGIAVYEACYDDVWDGVRLVTEVAESLY